MNFENIKSYCSGFKHSEEIIEILKESPKVNIHLKGLSGSSINLLLSNCLPSISNTHIIILPDKEKAAYFLNDINNILGKDLIQFFPSSYKRSVQFGQPDHPNIVLRTNILEKLSSPCSANISIVTYPEALIEKVISANNFNNSTIHLSVGERISIEHLNTKLIKNGFARVDFVYEPGQFAIRGAIVDVFSFSNTYPCRIDFFGDEIETIRTFNIDDQLSKESKGKITIIQDFRQFPETELSESETLSVLSFFDFIPANTIIWSYDIEYTIDLIKEIYIKFQSNNSDFTEINEFDSFDTSLIDGQNLKEKLKLFTVVEFGIHHFTASFSFSFSTSPQPAFNKNFELLGNALNENSDKGYLNIILSENERQIERLISIFNDINREVQFTPLLNILHEGFIDHDQKICWYTDHQIFDRYHKFKLKDDFIKKESITINEIFGLHPGDYVVHVDHGIGRFGGLEKIDTGGKTQEAIRLVYKDNDILFVSIHSLHKVSKYKAKDSSPPKINKLGSGTWLRLKERTKQKVKEITKDLISLYAKRKTWKGFEFSPDSYLQQELEASFFYEDTPDQVKATKTVKEKMEAKSPMDILVCGDVGFGKTEVAIRAAFKAVADSKQVVLLVPTTILALQHYKTFTDRLKNFPCNIDYLSRLKSTKKQKLSIARLAEGKTDIIIGTHRIVSNDVKFKDLGLLIIDEEQKFGVALKEKLKNIKLNVDTLTLSATPIPRTLQFSLIGIRDLSIISTPPPNRHPIITEVHLFNEDLIQEAIYYEVSRNGQVFFINNRVANIYELETVLNRICPDIKTVVAHGQMEGQKLENVMLDFIDGYYDVLIATTIIESGLDIPNANTIFINDAQNFGLSELHQLRGRVGRSNKKAFCFLFAPPLSSITNEARKRLKALEDFSDLGSGFNIAMQDMDIRGAGNLLGGEQSGFITDIGFDTYHRILNEAVNELKEEEDLKESFPEDDKEIRSKYPFHFIKDCLIDTDFEILFPEEYINNMSERIKLYRELDNIENENKLKEFENHLVDRFGQLPEPAKELLNIVRLRWIVQQMGFEKVLFKNNTLTAHFISDPHSLYFKSSIFKRILQFIQKQPALFRMKEHKNKLILSIKNTTSVSETIKILENILKE